MLDLHTHSKYSRHAVGELEDLVFSAIRHGVKVLAITDHAPFPIDMGNRLQPSELTEYFCTIMELRKKYADKLLILCGLEVDFTLQELDYVKKLIESVTVDYIIGAVHTVSVFDEQVNIWDIDKINHPEFIEKYFFMLEQLICSQLFDAVAHPDAILRGGISEEIYKKQITELLPAIIHSDLAYEVNTSGIRKERYDSRKKKIIAPCDDYAGMFMIPHLIQAGVKFTLGSDAHKPQDISSGICALKNNILVLGGNIVYYVNRKPVSYPQSHNTLI